MPFLRAKYLCNPTPPLQLTNGKPLAVLAKALIKAHGLLETLKIDEAKLDLYPPPPACQQNTQTGYFSNKIKL